ncbi:MAG: hemin ABC transporter substrate-binding protein [Rhodovulum sulfidophilum]|uniref:Hemin ABC transporter substrate-binding protein n=1 Tax=Rhodovulum sulfidophilum TaxID=35806 RepID=A0A2W5NDX1_RHOSU|nr:MAG: hemin ABC transporter substrate-binding protein [Rhodovulum sulfidophilum]
MTRGSLPGLRTLIGTGGRRALFGAFALLALSGAAPAATETAAGSGATRIAVAGGDIAEIVAALGAGGRVVGVDTTTLYPPELTELPSIGYARALSAEGVLSLAPDLLLGAHDAGPATALEQLRAAGLTVALAPGGEGMEAVPAKIAFVAGALGLGPEGQELTDAYRAEMAEVLEDVGAMPERPKVLFILTLRDGAPMVGGAGTSADAMIALAGGANAAQGFDGYKPMNREAIMAAAPDVILMMDRHGEENGPDEVLTLPEIAATPAGQAGRLVSMDGMLLLGFGPRTPQAVRELAALLHPGAPEPTEP